MAELDQLHGDGPVRREVIHEAVPGGRFIGRHLQKCKVPALVGADLEVTHEFRDDF